MVQDSGSEMEDINHEIALYLSEEDHRGATVIGECFEICDLYMILV